MFALGTRNQLRVPHNLVHGHIHNYLNRSLGDGGDEVLAGRAVSTAAISTSSMSLLVKGDRYRDIPCVGSRCTGAAEAGSPPPP
jgi:hypothetical protein